MVAENDSDDLGAKPRTVSGQAVAELPLPLEGMTGWPWTESGQPLSPAMRDGRRWPRISVVTPSYNQAPFLEETIRSVLLQGYPDLEYIIIDGGSNDGSVEIIRKYEPWLTYWVSQRDAGQSEAINKGFARATGEIVAWLNSDDTYEPGTLGAAAQALSTASGASLAYGNCHFLDDQGERGATWHTVQADFAMLLLEGNRIPQPTAFMRRDALAQVGWVDPALHYVMDYELWLRLAKFGRLVRDDEVTANFRLQAASKTMTHVSAFWDETLAVVERLRNQDIKPSPATIEEAIRRVHVRAALEGLFVGEPRLAQEHMAEALAAGVCPYGTPHRLAPWMVEWTSLSGQSLGDSEELISAWLDILSSLRARRWTRQIRRAVGSYAAVRRIFMAHSRGEMPYVRTHIWEALLQDPRWLTDPGVRSVVAQAYLPSAVVSKLRTIRRADDDDGRNVLT